VIIAVIVAHLHRKRQGSIKSITRRSQKEGMAAISEIMTQKCCQIVSAAISGGNAFKNHLSNSMK